MSVFDLFRPRVRLIQRIFEALDLALFYTALIGVDVDRLDPQPVPLIN